jgi:hypothetical protein
MIERVPSPKRSTKSIRCPCAPDLRGWKFIQDEDIHGFAIGQGLGKRVLHPIAGSIDISWSQSNPSLNANASRNYCDRPAPMIDDANPPDL